MPKGGAVALLTFCGAALKENVNEALPQMLMEEAEKGKTFVHNCFHLTLEAIVIPSGLLTDYKENTRLFPVGDDGIRRQGGL